MRYNWIKLQLQLLLILIIYASAHDVAKAQILPSPDVPLSPNNGGRSISVKALKPGDIVVSTTRDNISKTIRLITKSDVSHAMIFIGDGNVIEAVEEGVTVRPIDEALKDAKLAVAFRHPQLTAAGAKTVGDFAFKQLGKKFSIAGLIQHPKFGILPENCDALGGGQQGLCKAWKGAIRLALEIKLDQDVFSGRDEFFCSQLVAESYKQASIDLFKESSKAASPGDIPTLNLIGDLRYVGHLKAN